MSEVAEDWRAIRAASQERRATNRANALPALEGAGVPYQVHNGGAHIVVTSDDWTIDFWPGTGLWKSRGGGIQGRGIRGLLAVCKGAAK